jgi:hypothetical protein
MGTFRPLKLEYNEEERRKVITSLSKAFKANMQWESLFEPILDDFDT